MKKTYPLRALLIIAMFGLACNQASIGQSTSSPVFVTTLAGSNVGGYTDGQGTSASFVYPTGVAVDPNGNVYVGDCFVNQYRVRKISVNGTVTTLAGAGPNGYVDGQGQSARFIGPEVGAVDGAGNVYVADVGNHRIRKITTNGTVVSEQINRKFCE